MLTGVKTLAFELSVMLARVAVDAFGVTVSVAFFVAVKATVATFEVRPTWPYALLAPTSRRAEALTRAFFNRACIADSGLRFGPTCVASPRRNYKSHARGF